MLPRADLIDSNHGNVETSHPDLKEEMQFGHESLQDEASEDNTVAGGNTKDPKAMTAESHLKDQIVRWELVLVAVLTLREAAVAGTETSVLPELGTMRVAVSGMKETEGLKKQRGDRGMLEWDKAQLRKGRMEAPGDPEVHRHLPRTPMHGEAIQRQFPLEIHGLPDVNRPLRQRTLLAGQQTQLQQKTLLLPAQMQQLREQINGTERQRRIKL